MSVDVAYSDTARLQVPDEIPMADARIHACICYAEPVLSLVASQLIVQHPACGSAADRAVVGIDPVRVDRQLHRINKIAGEVVDRIDQCDQTAAVGTDQFLACPPLVGLLKAFR